MFPILDLRSEGIETVPYAVAPYGAAPAGGGGCSRCEGFRPAPRMDGSIIERIARVHNDATFCSF